MESAAALIAAYKLYQIYNGVQDVNKKNVEKYPDDIEKRKQADIFDSVGVIGKEFGKL